MAPLASDEINRLYLASEQLVGWGLAVLAAWALLNLTVSGYFVSRADRRYESYPFHGMNVGWGMINAGLACWGVLHLHFTAPAGLRLGDLVQAQLANENVFLLNAGLDVAYVMTGFFLRALAGLPAQPKPVRLLGFGRSLWVQGGFLLVFDVAMWSLLHGHGKSWVPLLG
ncbi:hypothetical protein Q3A66_15430 [Hymenobacter sp. BT770]|uniref:DUF6992 family protein n=1 Tax=Hymenobacter sp. BT770 TaxID=2886942 RepID=UPI001D1106F7|nr:hypothetical protein [Hymenobacter sp. BT770]MCC3154475.1 hypothetical protein [Hymenobacter sp. BT770]MDO3416460.1 hypothetical protein [Hymenobacter sp. BT770]